MKLKKLELRTGTTQCASQQQTDAAATTDCQSDRQSVSRPEAESL